MEINPDRLLADLYTLRSFGGTGKGVVRTTFSEVDMASRHWLVERLFDAGLEASIDGVGNVFGLSRNSGKAILTGSHSDTQPTGGWLDGALGVIYGLEVARALSESKQTSNLALDVVSWADEESSYVGLLGSRSFCGLLNQSEIDDAVGWDGRTLNQALTDAELNDIPARNFDPDRYHGYVEAHIEQGPYLEQENLQLGVVTSIVGMMDFEITIYGEQNHAGTTPMSLRKDAGMALIQLAVQLNENMAREADANSVWTIGKVDFNPGASSIVPGQARMHWQFRDPNQDNVEKFKSLTENVVLEFNRRNSVDVHLELEDDSATAQPMDAHLQSCLREAAEKCCPGRWKSMPSGASHDAQVLAQAIPSAMLFIPSLRGISHSFDEDSREEDIILGCQVLAEAIVGFFRRS